MPSWYCFIVATSRHETPKDHINIRILHSESGAQDGGFIKPVEKVVGGTMSTRQQAALLRWFHEAFALSTHKLQPLMRPRITGTGSGLTRLRFHG